MGAHPAFHNAMRAAQATVRQIHNAPPEWSWRSTADPCSFELWRHGESVGMLTVLPGHIERRAVLLDLIVDHLNT